MIAKVEPLTSARALRGPFDYELTEEMDGVGVGSVLRVPFGRRKLLGVVVEIAESSDVAPDKLAAPIEALEAGVPAELVVDELQREVERRLMRTRRFYDEGEW